MSQRGLKPVDREVGDMAWAACDPGLRESFCASAIRKSGLAYKPERRKLAQGANNMKACWALRAQILCLNLCVFSFVPALLPWHWPHVFTRYPDCSGPDG